MRELRFAPLLAPALAVTLGVALAGLLAVPAPVGAVGMGLMLSLSLPRLLMLRVAPVFLGLLAGTTCVSSRQEMLPHAERVVVLSGTVANHPRPLGDRWFVELRAETLRTREGFRQPPRWVRLEFPRNLDPPPIGSWVRVRGRLRRAPGFENRTRTPGGPWALSVKAGLFVESEPPSYGWRISGAVRQRVHQVWGELRKRSESAAALGEMLLLGNRWAALDRWQESLLRTGLFHLVAASGLNVALIAGGAYALTGFLKRPIQILVASTSVLAYLATVGPEPSLMRATLMAMGVLGSQLVARPGRSFHSLTVTLAVLLVLDPESFFDLGLRLSVAATAGILLLAEPIADRIQPWVRCRPLALSLGASIAAQVATVPDTYHTFGYLHFIGPLTNLLLGAAAALALATAVGVTVVAILGWETPVQLGLTGLSLLTAPFEWLQYLPPSPWIAWRAPRSVLELAPVAGLIAAFWVRSPRAQRNVLLFLAVSLWCRGPTPLKGVELVVADVGQGESLLLRTADQAVLIDGGGVVGRNLAAQVLVPLLAERQLGRVPLAVLTHPDRDHCHGMLQLARWVPLEEVWLPPSRYDSPCSQALARASRRPPLRLRAGMRRRLGTLEIRVLSPLPGARIPRGQDNAASVVLQITAEDRTVIFSGDLDRAQEIALIGNFGEELRADFLKVAHHGSRNSTSASWLATVRPRLALISAGPGNPFGHPHPDTLRRLAAVGCRFLRTDLLGSIELRWQKGLPLSVELPSAPRHFPGRLSFGDQDPTGS